MPLKQLLEAQQTWARKRWAPHTGPRAPTLRDNLVIPMCAEVIAQFSKGSGGELGKDDRSGKMMSLRSSSALAYNVFAPWRDHDITPLASAIGVSLIDGSIEFERQFRHGLPGTPPNLDVVLDGTQQRPLGIESKFTEPYGPKPDHPPIDDKYFAWKRERWAELGLPRCQTLARAIGRSVAFRRLGAGQLLKHILGLAYATRQSPRLLCLWYDSGCTEAAEFCSELDVFRDSIDESIAFSAATYQQSFERLRQAPEPAPGYLLYLYERYFAA